MILDAACYLLLISIRPTVAFEWDESILPNEATGPWHPHFRQRDPYVEGWSRTHDHPGVADLRLHLQDRNCIHDLEILSPQEPNYTIRAVGLFRRDGFVVVRDVLTSEQLANLENATFHILDKLSEADPRGSFGGGAGKLPCRYSLGDASETHSNFHLPAYSELIDLPAITPVLMDIFQSSEYMVAGAGGDVALAGAIEYQDLHMDAIWGSHPGRIQDFEVPPVVTFNFVLQNLSAINGPMRKIRGSHKWYDHPPPLIAEPDWMKLSTLCPVPAGAAIIRDNRCWHGGTPNLSDELRALPNLEYFAPGWPPSLGWLDAPTMPFEVWETLSPFARHLARAVVAPSGVAIPGAGHYSPGAILDIMPFMAR